jgi:phosphoribosyl-ATP pyrophosphohydrolase
MKKYYEDKFLELLDIKQKGKYIRFLHHTNKEEVAKKIIEEGFRYYDSFYKTTDEIIIDEIYLNYWFQLRRVYGSYAIVIIIAENVINKVNDLIKLKGNKLTDNFNVLSEELPEPCDDDFLFVLSKHYVRGFYDMNKHVVVFNPEFNPNFFSDKYLENIQFLKANQ